VRTRIEPREALIEYFIPYHALHPAIELHAIVVTHADVRRIRVALDSLRVGPRFTGRLATDGRAPLDSSPLGDAVVLTRRAIQAEDDAAAGAQLVALGGVLVGALSAEGVRPRDFDRWIIVPHRLLHPVPWAALPTEGCRCLLEDVAVTLSPSASLWARTAARARGTPTRFLALANPALPAATELPPLPEAEVEANQAARHLHGLRPEIFTGDAATESALRQHAPGTGIVHLAAHGEFPLEDAIDFHRVLLAPSREHDGVMRADEVRDLDLRTAQLVTLSICDGGLYRFGPGDEPYGLIPALLAAGAHNVVATLWSVADVAARRLMGHFYTHLMKCGPTEALRRAALALRDSGAPIGQWAVFVVVGPGRPFAEGTDSRDARADSGITLPS